MASLPEKLFFPGVIDPHTHMRALSQANRAENYETGTRAAAEGGIYLAGDMPNDPGRPVKTYLDMNIKRSLGLAQGYTKLMLIAGSQPEWNNESQLPAMLSIAGAAKFYAGTTTGNKNDIPVSAFMDAISVVHEQDPRLPIMVHLGQENAEEFIYEIAGRLNHPLYICHVRPSDMPHIIEAKKKSWPVYAEVCPHHLLLTSKDAETRGWFARMQPPLVSQIDGEYMWKLVRNGTIDTLGSDHAPHTRQAKWEAEQANQHGDPNHDCVCFGIPSLEHWMKLMFRQVQLGSITMERLMELTVTSPSRIFGIDPETIPEYEWLMKEFRIEDESKDVVSGSGWTPFLGMLGVGQVVNSPVIKNGQLKDKKPGIVKGKF